MLYLVAYDTDDDNKRNKLANHLKDLGGRRIQYSAFLIELSAETLQKLQSDAKKILSDTQARIFIMPICSRDLEKIKSLVHNYRQLWDEEPLLL